MKCTGIMQMYKSVQPGNKNCLSKYGKENQLPTWIQSNCSLILYNCIHKYFFLEINIAFESLIPFLD